MGVVQVQVQVFYFSKDTIRYISTAHTYNLTHFSVSDEVASREAKLIIQYYSREYEFIIQGKVKQHIDGSMQKGTAVFSSITEISHPCIKPPISVI